MTNHLWQSTLFAAAAGLLTVALRRNRAQVRFWLWFSASFKFLIPFSLLMNLGSHLRWEHVAAKISARHLPFTVIQVVQPFPDSAPFMTAARSNTSWLLITIAAVWVCGFAVIVLMRLRSWQRIRAAVRSAVPLRVPTLQVPAKIEIRSAPGLLEPGVVGVLRPILLLPAGVTERLTPLQMEAILAHELCHIRRRDNLFAAIHMTVEAIFWFHPLVWWIGARLVEERERACDEAVLSQMNEPRAYAEGILSVCRFYRESPLVCVSGVTGADLRQRIEAIMTNRIGRRLNRANKFVLASAGISALAVPLMVGMGNAPSVLAQSPAMPPRRFDVAAIKPDNSGANFLGIRVVPGGGLRVVNATLRSLIREAYQVRDFELAGGPAWLDSARYDIEAKGQVEVGSQEQTGLQIMKML
jgi:bla regulator protein BlaR1